MAEGPGLPARRLSSLTGARTAAASTSGAKAGGSDHPETGTPENEQDVEDILAPTDPQEQGQKDHHQAKKGQHQMFPVRKHVFPTPADGYASL